jgi:hypothetical protein
MSTSLEPTGGVRGHMCTCRVLDTGGTKISTICTLGMETLTISKALEEGALG